MVAKIRQQRILTYVFFPLTGRKVECSDKRLLVARGKRGSRRPGRKERSVTPHVLQADFWPASVGIRRYVSKREEPYRTCTLKKEHD